MSALSIEAQRMTKLPKKDYLTLSDLVGVFPKPLPQTYRAVRSLVLKQKAITKPATTGDGNSKRYIFKRENIQRLVDALLPQ